MLLTVRCQCGRVSNMDVRPGYNARAVLGAAGWTIAPGRYICPDCKFHLKDYSAMLGES